MGASAKDPLAARMRRRRRSRLWIVAALVPLLPVAGLSLFRAAPFQWPTTVVQFLSFMPWLVIPAAAGFALALFSRRSWLVVSAVVLLVAQLFWLFPLDGGRHVPGGSGRMVELTVMSINSEFGGADPAGIVRLVRDNGVGLLAIQEHAKKLEDGLAAAGLAELLPNRISAPTNDAGGSAVYSSHPLQELGMVPDSPFRMLEVRLSLDGPGGTAVLDATNVHALPPVDVRIAQWRHDLATVGRLAARPGNQLLIGDFNASYDHSEFRQLLDGGPDGRKMVDVGVAVGDRLMPTWPMDGLPLPGIVIDHIVTSPQIGGTDYSVHRVPGTDHAAIVATLEIPAAG